MPDPDSREYLEKQFNKTYSDLESKINDDNISVEVASALYWSILNEIHYFVEEEAYDLAAKLFKFIEKFGSKMFEVSKVNRLSGDFEISNQYWQLFLRTKLAQSLITLGKNSDKI